MNLVIAIITGAGFSLFYILNGGLTSVIKTDKLQFILMFAGFLVILIVLGGTYMSPIDLWHSLPETHTSLTGGQSFAYIVVWFFIGSWTMVDPGFHQRVYATTTQGIAKRGILWAVLFWFIFDLMTTLTGLYAFSFLPSETVPSQAFLVLANAVLPIGLQGLFYVGILATVMSTLDSNTLVSGITLGKDILSTFPSFKSHSTHVLIKASMLIVIIIGIIMAIWMPSVIDLWYTFGTISIPALLMPTLFSIFKRPLTQRAVLLNLSIPPLASFLWFLFGKIDEWSYFLGLEPFYPGLFCSLIILMLFKNPQKEASQ
jgi:SSS family solute:Na+ symporter